MASSLVLVDVDGQHHGTPEVTYRKADTVLLKNRVVELHVVSDKGAVVIIEQVGRHDEVVGLFTQIRAMIDRYVPTIVVRL